MRLLLARLPFPGGGYSSGEATCRSVDERQLPSPPLHEPSSPLPWPESSRNTPHTPSSLGSPGGRWVSEAEAAKQAALQALEQALLKLPRDERSRMFERYLELRKASESCELTAEAEQVLKEMGVHHLESSVRETDLAVDGRDVLQRPIGSTSCNAAGIKGISTFVVLTLDPDVVDAAHRYMACAANQTGVRCYKLLVPTPEGATFRIQPDFVQVLAISRETNMVPGVYHSSLSSPKQTACRSTHSW